MVEDGEQMTVLCMIPKAEQITTIAVLAKAAAVAQWAEWLVGFY